MREAFHAPANISDLFGLDAAAATLRPVAGDEDGARSAAAERLRPSSRARKHAAASPAESRR